MYRFFYALSPVKYRKWVTQQLNYCDFSVSPIKLIGFLIIFGLMAGFAAGLLLYGFGIVGLIGFLITWIAVLMGFEILSHLTLIFVADGRANFVEQILPDALQIVSANMRSGLTPDKAILTSARPEFGPLEKELRKAAKETLSGKSFEDALKGVTAKIKSKSLDKTIALVVEGLSKGGSITSLLDSVADDIRQARVLRNEIKSYVMMYGIFIFFAAGVGGPLLYSVATYLIQTMTTIGGSVDLGDSLTQSSIPLLKFGSAEIDVDFLRTYSYIAIVVTAFFGSLLIGLVQEGTEKGGLKFFPILLVVGLGVFTVTQIALKGIFGTLAG